MKLLNITDEAQCVLDSGGSSHVIPAREWRDIPDDDARQLWTQFPDRFAVQVSPPIEVKKSKKEREP